jgi:Zn-dependent peptidase ImmA (M78 family)/DNA-binding XRE family transcriptional regulator
LKGVSQAALARDVHVSAAAINQFEAGSAQPSPETLEGLSVALKVAPTFLARAHVSERGKPFFRSLRRVPSGERDRAHAYALTLADVVSQLERYLEFPELRIGRLMSASVETAPEEVETSAGRARRVWDIPSGPIANVVAMAESRGVVAAAVGSFHPGIDAFTLPGDPRPVVVLCSDKGVATRRRFDMAHELAHLALHDQQDEEPRWQEDQAHRFASAFLMPAEDIAKYLPIRGDDLRSLERVAHDWGVSMQAALMRARHLGLLDDDECTRGMRRLSAAGWRTKEPVEVGPPERPQLLVAAAGSLPDAGVTVQKLAEGIGLPLGRLERMLSLPEAKDDASAGELIPLRS